MNCQLGIISTILRTNTFYFTAVGEDNENNRIYNDRYYYAGACPPTIVLWPEDPRRGIIYYLYQNP